MGSHIITCHPTQVNTSCLNPRQTGFTGFAYPRGWKVELTSVLVVVVVVEVAGLKANERCRINCFKDDYHHQSSYRSP